MMTPLNPSILSVFSNDFGQVAQLATVDVRIKGNNAAAIFGFDPNWRTNSDQYKFCAVLVQFESEREWWEEKKCFVNEYS